MTLRRLPTNERGRLGSTRSRTRNATPTAIQAAYPARNHIGIQNDPMLHAKTSPTKYSSGNQSERGGNHSCHLFPIPSLRCLPAARIAASRSRQCLPTPHWRGPLSARPRACCPPKRLEPRTRRLRTQFSSGVRSACRFPGSSLIYSIYAHLSVPTSTISPASSWP